MKSALNKLSNLQQRVIFGFIGAVFLIGGIISGPIGFGLVFMSITLLSLDEFYSLATRNEVVPNKWLGILLGGLIYINSILVASELIQVKFFLAVFLFFGVFAIAQLFKSERENAFNSLAWSVLGIFYIVFPYSLFNFIAFFGTEYSYKTVLGFLFLLWASDTGAYFAGRALGRHKLFPSVSPKKTWEGSFGGLIGSLLVAALLSKFWPIWAPVHWIMVSLIIVVIGSYGDLVESLFKRSIDVKDSGSLIPGHGGLLDRFDGLLLASPFVAAYIYCFAC